MSYLNIFEFNNIGSKLIQEDSYLNFSCLDYECVFVFDGHGATKQKDSLPHLIVNNNILKKRFKDFFLKEELTIRNIEQFFIDFDNFLLVEKSILKEIGLCMSGIIIDKKKNNIFVLNIGDTKVLVYNSKKQNIYKTNVHNLDNENEIKRIKKCNKEHYIRNNRYKKLSMTRTIGDFDCKEPFNEPLIPKPEIVCISGPSGPKDHMAFPNHVCSTDCVNPIQLEYYFILATDGMNLGYEPNVIIALYEKKQKLTKYCEEINKKNLSSHRLVDNVCIIVCKIRKLDTQFLNPPRRCISGCEIASLDESETESFSFLSRFAATNVTRDTIVMQKQRNIRLLGSPIHNSTNNKAQHRLYDIDNIIYKTLRLVKI